MAENADILDVLRHWKSPLKLSINMAIEKKLAKMKEYRGDRELSRTLLPIKSCIKVQSLAETPQDPFLP